MSAAGCQMLNTHDKRMRTRDGISKDSPAKPLILAGSDRCCRQGGNHVKSKVQDYF